MGHSSIRIKVRRKKVANLAAYSRQYSVSNITKGVGGGNTNTRIVKDTDLIDYSWKNPKEGFPQPKSLRKKYKKKYCSSLGVLRKIVSHPSDYCKFPDHTFYPNLGKAWYMEQMVQHKTANWERKNPCPIKKDEIQPDIFEQEYVVPWKAKRDLAIERIRDFVVSVYDKLPLTGRFKQSENKYVEKPVAEIKDVQQEGHKVNELDPKKSKLLKKAQKITNKTHAKHSNLVSTNLKDHKRKKGRIILPEAA